MTRPFLDQYPPTLSALAAVTEQMMRYPATSVPGFETCRQEFLVVGQAAKRPSQPKLFQPSDAVASWHPGVCRKPSLVSKRGWREFNPPAILP